MGDQPSKPSDYVDTEEVTVKNEEDGYEIPCKLWKPKGKIRACALFVHGGMFSKGDRESHQAVSCCLAAQVGIAVMTVTFRDGSVTTHSSGKSISDLKSAANEVMKRYYNEPFGVVGSSSGGFFALALCNAMEAGKIKYCIPLCPVANPHTRAVYLGHCIDGTTPLSSGTDLYSVRQPPQRAQEILSNQMQYFKTFNMMIKAADSVLENKNDVPTLLILGSLDANIPHQVTQHHVDNWATRTVIIGGAGHEIQNCPPMLPNKTYIRDIEIFLQNLFKDDPYDPLWRPEDNPAEN